ncbi:ABC transporter ATP-binding protein [Paenibacillus xylaniclasticus]|uniref:ABC transporter ATP-binding protein n=1 Tax=Paenibacillus xylaniclasticus TaxID=588083 RepID=UPI000FD82644|nr:MULTISPECIES: ABC transporter ATP-binding protein [Paenibacillus]GFN29882.1 ABC transporter ATP-binding protein [Paenibacillus curdlanolyticus]
MAKPKKTIWRLLHYTFSYKYSYLVLICTMLIGIALELGVAWYLTEVTNAAIDTGSERWKSLIVTGVIILFFTVVNSFADIYFKARVSSLIRHDIRKNTMSKLLRMSEAYFAKNHSGELLSRVVSDNQAIGQVCTETILALIRNPLLVTFSFVYLLSLNWKLALICLFIGPMTIFIGKIFGNALRGNAHHLQQQNAKMTSVITEIVGTTVILKTFRLQDKLFRKFDYSSSGISKYEIKGGRINAMLAASSTFVGHFAFIVTFIVGSYFVSRGEMEIGALIAFIQLMNHLTWPFTGLAGLWGSFQQSLGAADRIFALIDEKSECERFPVQGLPVKESPGLSMEKVSFSYTEGERVLRDISLSIKPGEVAAIVGPSGGGKSTIFNLLLGMYPVEEGKIRIGQTDISSMDVHELRSHFSLVPQESQLYSGTIRENIAVGNPEASEEDIITAARNANAYEFIMGLPNGLDTDIGEGGANLSGGQKQRIAIARALLNPAPILLLDEATAALDSESERLVQDALEKLMAGRTTIIIAHRLSTVRNADQIIVLEDGQISATGTHEELMSMDGMYKKMVNNFSEGLADVSA